MSFYFYRIRLKGTDRFYAGPISKPKRKDYEYNGKKEFYYISVTVGIYWRDTYFWSCKKKSTLKQHLEYIFNFSKLGFEDLEIERCFVGKTEIVKDTELYSKHELASVALSGKAVS